MSNKEEIWYTIKDGVYTLDLRYFENNGVDKPNTILIQNENPPSIFNEVVIDAEDFGDDKYDLSSIESITIGSNITKVTINGLTHFRKLTHFTFGPDVVEIVGRLDNCDELQFVDFGQSLLAISGCMFIGSKKLEEVLVPASVNKIGSYAFSYGEHNQALVVFESIDTVLSDENSPNWDKESIARMKIKKDGTSIVDSRIGNKIKIANYVYREEVCKLLTKMLSIHKDNGRNMLITYAAGKIDNSTNASISHTVHHVDAHPDQRFKLVQKAIKRRNEEIEIIEDKSLTDEELVATIIRILGRYAPPGDHVPDVNALIASLTEFQ